jgi:competence protein ComGC
MFKNSKGFTLIEMLIVMLVISVLMLLLIPNLTKQSESVNEKGCDALVSLVQSQADAYYLDTGNRANGINILVADGYLTDEQRKCGEADITVSNGVASNPNSR